METTCGRHAFWCWQTHPSFTVKRRSRLSFEPTSCQYPCCYMMLAGVQWIPWVPHPVSMWLDPYDPMTLISWCVHHNSTHDVKQDGAGRGRNKEAPDVEPGHTLWQQNSLWRMRRGKPGAAPEPPCYYPQPSAILPPLQSFKDAVLGDSWEMPRWDSQILQYIRIAYSFPHVDYKPIDCLSVPTIRLSQSCVTFWQWHLSS